MKTSENQAAQALSELYHEAGTYRNAHDVMELYEFISKLPQVAPFNAMLLHMQKPGSEFVAPPSVWMKEYNRTIKPGARPLVILVPFGPVGYVFDVSDTEGSHPFPQELLAPFQTKGKLGGGVVRSLVGNLARYAISYHRPDLGSQAAGSISVADPPSTQRVEISTTEFATARVFYHLEVNRNLDRETEFSTIAHELGHLFCGHLGDLGRDWWPDRREIANATREFEAESVAWLVCRRAGVECPSAAYLSSVLESNGVVPAVRLGDILRAAGWVESMAKGTVPWRDGVIIERKKKTALVTTVR